MNNMRQLVLTNIIIFFTLLVDFSALAQSASSVDDSAVQLTKVARWDNDSLKQSGDQTFNEIWGWTSSEGREYVIMGSLDSIYFFDINQPDSPFVADAIAGNYSNAIHRDFATYRHYAYAVADEGRSALKVFDLQYLPDSVALVYDNEEFCSRAHNVYQEGGRLYLAANDTRKRSFPLSVLSISDPENPKLLDHLDPSGMPSSPSFDNFHDVYVRDNIVYGSAEENGFFIVNYQQPDSPFVISSISQYPFKGYNHSSWLTEDGNTMVMADENNGNPLKAVDIANLRDPSVKSVFGKNYKEGSIPHNPLIKNELAFVSYYHEGLQVFDVSEPADPRLIDSFDTYPQNNKGSYPGYRGCWGVYPFFESGLIAASDQTNGLFLFRLDTVKQGETLPSDTLNFSFNANVYPNPFSNELRFQLESSESVDCQIQILDPLGKKHYEQEVSLERGQNALQIKDFAPVSEGVYLLKIKAKGTTRVFKVVKE